MKRFRLLAVLPLLVFLVLVIRYLLPRLSAVEDSIALIQRLSWPLLALAFAAQAASYIANGSLLRVTVALAGERLATLRAVAIVMAASTVALAAGGLVGYAAAIHRWTAASGTRKSTATLAATIPPLFDGAALVVFALASAIELLRRGRLTPASERALVIVVSAIAIVVVAACVVFMSPRRTRRLLRGKRGKELLRTFKIVSRNMQRGAAVRATLCALLTVTFDVLTLELAFVAAGHPIGLRTLLAGYGVPLLLGRMSFLPGGIAVIEVAMVAAYVSLGIAPALAVVAVVAYRLISFWLPTLAGIPVAIVLQTRGTVALREG